MQISKRDSVSFQSKHDPAEELTESSAILLWRRSGEVFGLIVALGLTTLLWWPSIASRLLPADLVWRNVAAQAIDWLFCLVLIGIVLSWEHLFRNSTGGTCHQDVMPDLGTQT